jgi:hypothetical protein
LNIAFSKPRKIMARGSVLEMAESRKWKLPG